MFFADNAALQAGVHGDQFRKLAQDLLMYRLGLAHDIACRLGLPTWVAAGVLHFKICQPEYGRYHASGCQFAALDGAALAGLDLHLIILCGHRSQIR